MYSDSLGLWYELLWKNANGIQLCCLLKSPVLTGLELMFMGVTWSNSGLFSTPGFVVFPVGKRGRGQTKKMEGGKKGIEKEMKEGSSNKERSEAR